MQRGTRGLCGVLALLGLCTCSHIVDGEVVFLPGGGNGIGFDDLRWSPSQKKVLAPGGGTGNVYLIDPSTAEVTSISGFGTASYDGGHADGPTSVDEGEGLFFVTDRTTLKLHVVDPTAKAIVASAPLSGSPDYVRYVAATRELWVTEPSGARIEIFTLPSASPPTPVHAAFVPVTDGPESMVVDELRGRVYVHRWHEKTLAFDVRTRALAAEWDNGCAASRGIALDARRGFLFAACLEGTVSSVDVRDGRRISSIARGAGFDVIGYDAARAHLYLAGSACQCLVMLGVRDAGELVFLGRFEAPEDAHCVTADERGNAWVCSPDAGLLRRVPDPFPPGGG